MEQTKSIKSREKIIQNVLLMGVLNANGSYVKGSKNKIRSYFIKNHPSQIDFARFIENEYGWHGVSIMDSRVSFKPYDFFYNQAGLQFKYRDENKIIKLECLKWDDVANRTGKLIYDGQYFETPVNAKKDIEKPR